MLALLEPRIPEAQVLLERSDGLVLEFMSHCAFKGDDAQYSSAARLQKDIQRCQRDLVPAVVINGWLK